MLIAFKPRILTIFNLLLILATCTISSSPQQIKFFIKFLKSQNCKVINRNLDKIHESCEIYHQSPGFIKITNELENLCARDQLSFNPKLALGLIYELTESLRLYKSANPIEKFQIKTHCQNTGICRIFDAQDYNMDYEFKNICWEIVEQFPTLREKIMKQLLDEKYLSDINNRDFIICSNQKISDFWKVFFKKNKISYIDNTQSCDNNLD